MAKAAAKKPPTKSEILAKCAEDADLSKAQVKAVFDSLSEQIKKTLGPRGAKAFAIPDLLKITVQHKPATKARPGKNPFTGEDIMIKAKPARNIVKARPLKKLKDMA